MLTWAIVYAIVNAFIPPWYVLVGVVGDVLLGLFAVAAVTAAIKAKANAVQVVRLEDGLSEGLSDVLGTVN